MRLLLFLIVLVSSLLPAQESQSRPTVVRASGEAAVSVRPNQSRLRLSVVSTAASAERARAKNAERATDLISRLRALLGQDANIRTAVYSLTRNYTDAYVANNRIEVQVNDPAIAGKIIDIATKSGASVIGGIEPSVLDEQDAWAEALKQATARAQTNAEAISAALGLRVIRVLSAEASTLPVTTTSLLSGPRIQAKKKTDVPTPVASGTIEIRTQVTVTLEVAR